MVNTTTGVGVSDAPLARKGAAAGTQGRPGR